VARDRADAGQARGAPDEYERTSIHGSHRPRRTPLPLPRKRSRPASR
jgi:hypothetical protein